MAESNGDELESELVSFREHWQEEIKGEQEVKEQGVRHQIEDIPLTIEERATQLFLEGARYEKDGQFNVAVYYYRQAVHLVPDIEFKIAESKRSTGFDSNDVSDDDDDDSETDQPHYEHFDNKLLMDSVDNSVSLMSIAGLCAPETPQTAMHVSALPTELLSLLFRWVVSKDLDVKSLSQLSLVCKWFYVCARDQEIWKQICLRVWGITCDIALYDNNWRQMYLERPHVKLDGVYISTNTYIHIGEPTVGSYYKPCHLVQYCKYLRFFSDGTVLVYTSAEDPQTVMQLLTHPPYRDPSINKGYYRLSEPDKVNVFYTRVLKPKKDFTRRRNREKPEIREHQFFMTLSLKNSVRRRNRHLAWDVYMYQIKNRKTGEISENEIPFNSFKPFAFNRVQSYLSQSFNSI